MTSPVQRPEKASGSRSDFALCWLAGSHGGTLPDFAVGRLDLQTDAAALVGAEYDIVFADIDAERAGSTLVGLRR
jgi:hypothetical protein